MWFSRSSKLYEYCLVVLDSSIAPGDGSINKLFDIPGVNAGWEQLEALKCGSHLMWAILSIDASHSTQLSAGLYVCVLN